MARHRRRSDDVETEYWLSYSDMMAALLLVFILIITLTMFHARKQFDEKQLQLEEQQVVIKEQQEKLDKIIGVRGDLVEALKAEFDGTDLSVSVDSNTGAITLDSSILFDVNKYDIKQSGADFLKAFLPRYLGVLLNDNNKQYISEIIIEGHTDTNGTYMHNLELSQDRALSVASFCLQDGSSILGSEVELNELRKIITANGRAYSDPVLNEDGTVNLKKSRRVEFKFRLKDQEMVKEMNAILSGEQE